jgi:hypothetical protein
MLLLRFLDILHPFLFSLKRTSYHNVVKLNITPICAVMEVPRLLESISLNHVNNELIATGVMKNLIPVYFIKVIE